MGTYVLHHVSGSHFLMHYSTATSLLNKMLLTRSVKECLKNHAKFKIVTLLQYLRTHKIRRHYFWTVFLYTLFTFSRTFQLSFTNLKFLILEETNVWWHFTALNQWLFTCRSKSLYWANISSRNTRSLHCSWALLPSHIMLVINTDHFVYLTSHRDELFDWVIGYQGTWNTHIFN